MQQNFYKVIGLSILITILCTPFSMNGTYKTPHKSAATPVNLTPATAENVFALEATLLADSLQLEKKGLSKKTLAYALKGYNYLESKGLLVNKQLLSICDFSQSSKRKRLYIIDLVHKKLVLNTYVAHGRNSGAEFARSFSNSPESLKSSLGFYITSRTYFGGHGLSLKIEGMEKGFNDKADARNIVVHGSDYIGCDPRSTPKAGRS